MSLEGTNMSTTAIIIVVVLAVIAVAALAALLMIVAKERERRNLKQRFGPEYDRTVQAAEDRKRAEVDLRDRVERRKGLNLRTLTPPERDRYREDWRRVQAAFVDAPTAALGQADTLITSIMVDRGYPMQDFEGQADVISVDYPEIVENYRQAHGIYLQAQTGATSTEDARRAFVSYRSLFAQLAGTDDGTAPTASPTLSHRGPDRASRGGSAF
jgi:hypothetical protein